MPFLAKKRQKNLPASAFSEISSIIGVENPVERSGRKRRLRDMSSLDQNHCLISA
ncbi:MAG: hypothetical protein K6G15_11590 [Desulfovibrio sp.]|nr:hypothetical protein [Desulfovibrio sp.]